MKVYVVLWYNYGDQGTDYLGAFSTYEKAEKFIISKVEKYITKQDFKIVESEVQ